MKRYFSREVSLRKEISEWEGDHHCVKAKGVWQKLFIEYTACIIKWLEGPKGSLLIVSERSTYVLLKKVSI